MVTSEQHEKSFVPTVRRGGRGDIIFLKLCRDVSRKSCLLLSPPPFSRWLLFASFFSRPPRAIWGHGVGRGGGDFLSGGSGRMGQQHRDGRRHRWALGNVWGRGWLLMNCGGLSSRFAPFQNDIRTISVHSHCFTLPQCPYPC